MRIILLALALAVVPLFIAAAAAGTIRYVETDDAIWLTDFPEETPADLTAIREAAARNSWGKVSHDPATDTTVIDASLWIGDDVTLGTFLQIGRPEHPEETVIVKGDVWVRPPQESMARSDGRLSIVNRLQLGKPGNPSTRATLRIACDQRGQYGIRVGFRDGATIVSRGELHVYNSTITAAVQDRDHMLKAWGWYGSDVRLINATVSWIDGCMAYGVQAHNGRVEGTTFEHGRAALQNGRQIARNCVFRHLATAVAEGGCLHATLVGCRFENNGRNWTLGGSSGQAVTMIDCDVGTQRDPIHLVKNAISPAEATRRKIPIYPVYEEWRTLVVRVVDAGGRPIPDAWVDVTCTSDPDAVRNGLSLTDENGQTPDAPDNGGVLSLVNRLQATDDPDGPDTLEFTYTVAVRKTGFATVRRTLDDVGDVSSPLTIELK